MPLTFDQLADEVLHLPAAARGELIEKLVESLDASDNEEVRRAWAAEALRRRDEVRSGLVQAIPGEQVLAEVRRLVGR